MLFSPLVIGPGTVPGFARGVYLQRDEARGRWVLQAPERVLTADAAAYEILSRCQGLVTVEEIARQIAEMHDAAQGVVLADVMALLQDLADRRYLRHGCGDVTIAQQNQAPTMLGENLPIAALAELTHRCPLQCPYCSNPLELERAGSELTTAEWKHIISQMPALGVLQIHFSGGEPMARKDLPELVAHAHGAGLYVNLITSGVLLDRHNLAALSDAGLSHVQISFQGTDPLRADHVAGFRGALAKKRVAAVLIREAGLPLTVNAVMHRTNMDQLEPLIALAREVDAWRLEVAHVQYMGWALKNRAALMPSQQQFEDGARIVDAARQALRGLLVIDHVIPDYYAVRPKKCMGGWARQFFTITPSGVVLPCHAAQSLPGLVFESARAKPLDWIWHHSSAMNRYRGTGWMPQPCQSCEFREQDLGGCRCQAFALTGDGANTDPVCAKSDQNPRIAELARTEAQSPDDAFSYRNFSGAV